MTKYNAEYYQAHREQIQDSQKRWCVRNAERLCAYRQEYYRKNLEVMREKSRERARLWYQR